MTPRITVPWAASLVGGEDRPLPGCGWLPDDWLPLEETRKALRALAREGKGELVGYGAAQGLLPLRRMLADRLADRGIPARPEAVILTDGILQGADLLCRALTHPGDRVLVDDPGYFNFNNLIRANGLEPIPIPWTREGPDLQTYEAALRTWTPRLHITNAFLHNPTGGSLSPRVAHRMLALAEAHGLAIVEDDIYADLDPSPSPRLSAMDGLRRVAHVGGFTKTQSAAARIGYMVVPDSWVAPLLDLHMATSFGSGALAAQLAHRLLSTGAHRRHTDSLRTRLAESAGRCLTQLKALGFTPWEAYRGGLPFGWNCPGGSIPACWPAPPSAMAWSWPLGSSSVTGKHCPTGCASTPPIATDPISGPDWGGCSRIRTERKSSGIESRLGQHPVELPHLGFPVRGFLHARGEFLHEVGLTQVVQHPRAGQRQGLPFHQDTRTTELHQADSAHPQTITRRIQLFHHLIVQ
ncbi:MAG: PLP-dependent aminotransferase family protein [Rhodospirillum sp.]|nr:PLP-dependent aminotransferase family protein [Rhodospirillum sp.]